VANSIGGGGGAIGGPAKVGRLSYRPGYNGGGAARGVSQGHRGYGRFGHVNVPSSGPLTYRGPTYNMSRGGDGSGDYVSSVRKYDQPAWARNRARNVELIGSRYRGGGGPGNCAPTGTPEKGFWEGLWEHLKPGQIVPYLWQEAPKVAERLYQVVRALPLPQPSDFAPGLGPLIPKPVRELVPEPYRDVLFGPPDWYEELMPPGVQQWEGPETVGELIDDTAAWLRTPEGRATATLVLAGVIVVATGGAALAAFGPGAVLTAAAVGAGAGAVSGAAGVWIDSQFSGEEAKPADYIRGALEGAIGGAVAGVVGR